MSQLAGARPGTDKLLLDTEQETRGLTTLRSETTSPTRAKWHDKLSRWVLVVDIAMIAVAVCLTYLAKFGLAHDLPLSGVPQVSYEIVIVIFAVTWLASLGANESRNPSILGAGIEEYRRVLSASMYAFGALAILSYLANASVSRLFFAMTLPVGLVLILIGRWAVRQRLVQARRRGEATSRTLILGDQLDVERVVRDLNKNPEAGFLPVAVSVTDASPDETDRVHGLRNLPYRGLIPHMAMFGVDTIVVAGGLSSEEVRRLSWQCEELQTNLLFTPRITDVAGPRMSLRQASGIELIHVALPRYSGAKFWVKRSFDIVFSAIALLLLWPVLALIAIAIKLDDGGPVIFRQQRIGIGGEPFTIHKFRTMSVDAESKVAELIEKAGGKALLFKMENDPRITRIGGFLRKYSLDELLQFWTVLRGGMSVVGPRPQVAREVAEYTDDTHRRLLIRPGITGLWQVNGRSSLTQEESVRLDLRYVENWTLTGDISIIMKTVGVMLKPGDDAY